MASGDFVMDSYLKESEIFTAVLLIFMKVAMKHVSPLMIMQGLIAFVVGRAFILSIDLVT